MGWDFLYILRRDLNGDAAFETLALSAAITQPFGSLQIPYVEERVLSNL